MSATAIARHLLVNNVALTALIPAARIFTGAVPVGTEMPAIAVGGVSGMPRNIVAMNATKSLVTARVQVTIYAKTYALQKQYLALVLAALPNTHGTVNTFDCDSILPDTEGPDIYDDVLIVYEQSQDFMIKYNR